LRSLSLSLVSLSTISFHAHTYRELARLTAQNERATHGLLLEEAILLVGGVVADGRSEQRFRGARRLRRGAGAAGGRGSTGPGQKGGREASRKGSVLWRDGERERESEKARKRSRWQNRGGIDPPKKKLNLVLNLFFLFFPSPLQACARYAEAELRGPASPGALYNHAVALTDFSRIPPETGSVDGSGSGNDASSSSLQLSPAEVERTRRARLRQAAAKYHEAITEESASAAPSAAAERSSSQAASSNSNSSPQALNNLGLVLQELSSFEAAGSRERAALAAAAAARFRAAARGRPDFERAVYNLGTVLYASVPPANSNASASSVPSTPSSSSTSNSSPQQQSRAEALADAAQCIALAAALAPSAPVYARSLALVQPFLPLPRLRAGWLLVPDPLPLGTVNSPSTSSSHQQQANASTSFFLPGSVTAIGKSPPSIFPSSRERFVARWCVIDAEALRAAGAPADAAAALPRGWASDFDGENHVSSSENGYFYSSHQHATHHHARPLRIPLAEILSATPAADASLPEPAGAGLHLRFASASSSTSRPSSSVSAPSTGCFLVAPSHAAAEAWADALCVAGHVARSSSSSSRGGSGGGSAALARVLAPAVGTVAVAGAGPLAHRRPSSSGLAR